MESDVAPEGIFRVIPAADVAPYVRCYHVGVGGCGVGHLDSVPIPAWDFMRLVVHFADPVGAELAGQRVVFSEPMLGGAIRQPFAMKPSGGAMRFISTEFTATGFFALFGDVAKHCENSVTSLWDHVPTSRRRMLVDELSAYPRPRQWGRVMDAFLRDLPVSLQHERRARRVHQVARLVGSSRRVPRVKELATELGVSTRTLRNEFAMVLGSTPKRYLDNQRVTRAFRALFDHPELSGAVLAQNAGYYDQAHFIRSMKAYTGFAPSKLPRELFALARAVS